MSKKKKRICLIYLLLESKEGKERERERNIIVWLPLTHPTGDLACNPGMCPDYELNQWPCGLQACTPSTELQQPGWKKKDFKYLQKSKFLQKRF